MEYGVHYESIKKVSIAAALMASVGAMAVPAIAGPGHSHDKKMHHKKMIYKKLELTEAQKAQIKAGKEQRQAQMQANKGQYKVIKKEINQLMQADTLDQNRLRSLLQQEANLKAAKMANKHAASQEFKAILTEEQRVKLAAIKAKMKEKRAMHKEKREARREARKEARQASRSE